MPFTIEIEQEVDGRWIAESRELPGVMVYGQTRQEAMDRIQSLSLRVMDNDDSEKGYSGHPGDVKTT